MIDGWFTQRQGKLAGYAFSFLPEAQSIPSLPELPCYRAPLSCFPWTFLLHFSTVKYEYTLKNILF